MFFFVFFIVSPESLFFLFFFGFFVFSFQLCKKVSGRTLGRQKDAKSTVDLGGGDQLYISIDIQIMY